MQGQEECIKITVKRTGVQTTGKIGEQRVPLAELLRCRIAAYYIFARVHILPGELFHIIGVLSYDVKNG